MSIGLFCALVHGAFETDNSCKRLRMRGLRTLLRKIVAIIRLAAGITIYISTRYNLNVSFCDETDNYAYLADKSMLQETFENGG